MTGCSGECCFDVMYCEWYGICDFVVLSVVEVCADYVGVDVLHVCLDFGVVYGVGVYVNVCGVVCVLVCCLFLTYVVCESYVVIDQCDEPPPCLCSLCIWWCSWAFLVF